MMAVFRHELRSSFHSMTAYVFAAFLLAMIGVGAMLYNIELAVSNFEYAESRNGKWENCSGRLHRQFSVDGRGLPLYRHGEERFRL